MARTRISGVVERVVDGDTIRVKHDHLDEAESLRILALDTEEKNPSSGKPVTPWGIKASEEADRFFSPGDTVELEFPGGEPVEECMTRYRGNFGRLLVYVYKDGVDFQEHMIKKGFSPYFSKYGNAPDELHLKYIQAERESQSQFIGVWDQITVNGSEIRNYAALCTWWSLRAAVIDQYRNVAPAQNDLLNSRLDYAEIVRRAQAQENCTVFTEVRSLERIGDRSAVIKIGSIKQPFTIFLPDVESEIGKATVHLLKNRYFSSDDNHPRRSYCYISGKLSEFNGNPQIVLNSLDQLSDHFIPTA